LKNNGKNMMYFEPLLENYNIMLERLKFDKESNIQTFNFGLGNENTTKTFYVSSNEAASSSYLEPEKHLQLHPHVKFNRIINNIPIKRLDDLELDLTNFNFINIDVQGAELDVFKGAEKTLENIDYIMSEINIDNVYKKCSKLWDLDEFLNKYKFKRVITSMDGILWGDAFYIKEK
jgi:FkbM family methyltransferase